MIKPSVHNLREAQHLPHLISVESTALHCCYRTDALQRVFNPVVVFSLLTSCVLAPLSHRIVLKASVRTPPAFSTRSTRLRRPAAAEKHSSIAHRVRRLNGSSHQRRRFGAEPPFHSQYRRRRVACPSYVLGSA